MADKKPDKKSDKKAAPAGPEKRGIELIIAEIFILGGLLLAGLFLVMGWLDIGSTGRTGTDVFESLKIFLVGLLGSVQALSAFACLLFVMGIIYTKFKMGQLKREQKLKVKIEEATAQKIEKEEATENKKWKRVLEHVSSANPSDWRLSVLEADILLGELLTKMGYKGEGIGEQLKSVEPSDFKTLNEAWEAHKIRNTIAHEGSDFAFSQREARRVIGLFETVFKEFEYI
jgi:hypothetical protein